MSQAFGGPEQAALTRQKALEQSGLDLGKPYSLPGLDHVPDGVRLYAHDGRYGGFDAVYQRSNTETLNFLNSLPKEYFNKHNLVVGSVHDSDRARFDPFKESQLEKITSALGLKLFDKLGDIRSLPGYNRAKSYFDRMTFGVAGKAFHQLWNKLKAEDHWLADRYQETGPFGLFYHIVNNSQFNYRKMEDDLLHHWKEGSLLPSAGNIAQEIFGLPQHMKAFMMEPMYPELDHETLFHKPMTDLSENPRFLAIIAAHMFGGMM